MPGSIRTGARPRTIQRARRVGRRTWIGRLTSAMPINAQLRQLLWRSVVGFRTCLCRVSGFRKFTDASRPNISSCSWYSSSSLCSWPSAASWSCSWPASTSPAHGSSHYDRQQCHEQPHRKLPSIQNLSASRDESRSSPRQRHCLSPARNRLPRPRNQPHQRPFRRSRHESLGSSPSSPSQPRLFACGSRRRRHGHQLPTPCSISQASTSRHPRGSPLSPTRT